ncbi:MAG: hypothetical protein H0X45_02200 [Planctomycetes bacterium]|nr:hypothetical protein [Planctomycetota bacterium]
MTAQGGGLDRLAELIAEAFGLDSDGPGMPVLASVVQQRMAAEGIVDQGRYLEQFDGASLADAELRRIGDLLTVSETLFFRTRPHLDAFIAEALPERLATKPGCVSILSAGCATGEEPYSLAILVREHLSPSDAGRVRIIALDLDRDAIVHARRGRFSSWSLRETSTAQRARWFRADGTGFVLDPTIRDMVEFRVVNLLAPDPVLWHPGTFDIVFCRNVTIYFTERALRLMAERLADALAQGGYLFIGHSESLQGVTAAVKLRHAHGAFFYRKPLASETRSRSPMQPPHSERPPTIDVDAAINLLRYERFTEIESLTRAGGDDGEPPTLLLLARAVALMNLEGPACDEANLLCDRIVAMAPSLTDAHLLKALLCENAGANDAASRAYLAALGCEPGCAMAHLGLGRIAQRRSDATKARDAYQEALRLLPTEADARLVLFAGGFSRDLLMQFCRSELDALLDQWPAVKP